ncbi:MULTISPECIES: DsbA family protein [unclassified Serratia (in: enterobacteria)]|uniref:DsbA family protein n=1 Tax=unclassified Serratia (in: enterobacteria) TaxID=2647522 RepID=UPI0005027A8B|nr:MULTISPECIES: DsbA family protein [unclassified Serratia (in: enterobacteria)]KFK94003.1 protein-disulfide isomerase [Serratia sp. Ag2]KFK97727.1 protein-disulfide isomerase [Serratia sp. Ag1]
MNTATLHYIFDPLCGWCYGAAPLVQAAQTLPGLRIALHAGGMMTGSNRRRLGDEWRNYVMPHDKRIASLTGQKFGEKYFNGLLRDTTAVMDSTPPITAILAAEQIAGRGVDMLRLIQEAHYQEGQRIADTPVLTSLAKALGLSTAVFLAEMRFKSGAPTTQHIAESRALLAQIQGHGFPTFALQHSDGHLRQIPVGNYLGDVAAWKELLSNTAH